ncbi:MAG: hypothetical protein GXP47_06385 [Acidobacteria bacterium]|nr:hypothetical protein [Acidobacteriota bacterium]
MQEKNGAGEVVPPTRGEPGREWNVRNRRWFAAGMALVGTGTVGAAMVGSWLWPWGDSAKPTPVLWGCMGVALLAIVAGAVTMLHLSRSRTDGAEASDRDEILYSRYLTGLGFALLTVALSTAISASGLVHNGWIETSGEAFRQASASNGAGERQRRTTGRENELPPRDKVGLILLLSTEMSLLGALFFVTNRLRTKRDELHGPRAEAFDGLRFWGGTFFRMGEAVLFTFVFFWLFWKYMGQANGVDYSFLPILALLLGMFVKTGERMIFGLGERLLAAAGQLFPVTRSESLGRGETEANAVREGKDREDANEDSENVATS